MELDARKLLSHWWSWRTGHDWEQGLTRIRQTVAQLPVAACLGDEALSGLVAQLESLPGVHQCALVLGGEEISVARRDMVRHCPLAATCLWRQRDVAAGLTTCGGCLAQGVRRQVLRLPADANAQLLVDTPAAPGRPLLGLLAEIAPGLSSGVQLVRYLRAQQHRAAHFQQGALARELHDSVAQQLAYLSFQVTLLHGRLHDRSQAEATLGELRGGLSHLQRQVRELITSARLTMDGRTLRQALVDSVAEFSRRCIIAFELDNRLADGALSPETELQLLQIIREALTNAVRHSHGRHVLIELRDTRDGVINICVEDDGIGLGPVADLDNHFGLAIIRERAASIGATLMLEGVAPHGTRVRLRLAHPHALSSRRTPDEQHSAAAD